MMGWLAIHCIEWYAYLCVCVYVCGRRSAGPLPAHHKKLHETEMRRVPSPALKMDLGHGYSIIQHLRPVPVHPTNDDAEASFLSPDNSCLVISHRDQPDRGVGIFGPACLPVHPFLAGSLRYSVLSLSLSQTNYSAERRRRSKGCPVMCFG